MEDLRKYTRKSELYKLSAEEQTEKMKLVMKEVEKISAYTRVSEEAAYNLFLNGYDTNRMHQPAAQYPVFFSYYLIYINLLRKGEINYGITESYNQQPTGTSHETGRSIR